MSKFYRVKQDTPQWEEGAILKRNDETGYSAISDLWDTFTEKYPKDYYETEAIIENNPDWYERVYEVSVLGKAKFLAKDAAKEVHKKLHKEG